MKKGNLKSSCLSVEMKGFEPPTLWSQTRCASQLRYISVTLSELRCKISDKISHNQIWAHFFCENLHFLQNQPLKNRMQGIFTNPLHA